MLVVAAAVGSLAGRELLYRPLALRRYDAHTFPQILPLAVCSFETVSARGAYVW